MTDFSPREIVSELDRFIVGQKDAKRAVAIALRNRWRRLRLEGAMREEVLPKNILMIGPTGCGKTEISRRLAKLARRAFSESRGDEIHRGRLCRPRCRADRPRSRRDRDHDDEGSKSARRFMRAPQLAAEERVLDALVGTTPSASTRDSFRKRLRAGELDDKEIEIEMRASRVGDADVRNSRHAGLGDRRDFDRRYFRQGARQSRQDAAHHRQGRPRPLDRRGKRQDDRSGPDRSGSDPRGRKQRDRVSRRDRQDLRARGAWRRRCLARGRAARSAAAHRRHHGRDQAWHGEDRSHSVHRLGRLPCRRNPPIFCPNCKAGCR